MNCSMADCGVLGGPRTLRNKRRTLGTLMTLTYAFQNIKSKLGKHQEHFTKSGSMNTDKDTFTHTCFRQRKTNAIIYENRPE